MLLPGRSFALIRFKIRQKHTFCFLSSVSLSPNNDVNISLTRPSVVRTFSDLNKHNETHNSMTTFNVFSYFYALSSNTSDAMLSGYTKYRE